MVDVEVNGKTLAGIELVIFDKDGTLFQLYPYCSKMALERTDALCRALHEDDAALKEWLVRLMGVDRQADRIFPKGPIGVYSKYYAQEMLFNELNARGHAVDRETVRRAFADADGHISDVGYLKNALVPVDGMLDFVKSMSSRCRCAIFSNDMTARLNDTLELFGIRECFSYVLGGDQVERQKPDPMGALAIMGRLGISPEHTLLIGDSALDIESGKRARCKYLVSIISDISDMGYLKDNALVVSSFREIKLL